jgi:hypothetical protein
VKSHYRSSPDGNPYNNWSYPGNTNPYTGKVAKGNPSTYLKNYYKNTNKAIDNSYEPSSSELFQSYQNLLDEYDIDTGSYQYQNLMKDYLDILNVELEKILQKRIRY